jgi:hypothetical protein
MMAPEWERLAANRGDHAAGEALPMVVLDLVGQVTP